MKDKKDKAKIVEIKWGKTISMAISDKVAEILRRQDTHVYAVVEFRNGEETRIKGVYRRKEDAKLKQERIEDNEMQSYDGRNPWWLHVAVLKFKLKG